MEMLKNLVDSLDGSLNIELSAMSRQIVISNSNISSLGDNANAFKKNRNFLGNKPQRKEYYTNEKVNENKNVKVAVVKDRKIAIFTTSAKSIVEKLLIMSTKVLLIKDG